MNDEQDSSISNILRQAELAKLAAKAGKQHHIQGRAATNAEVVDGHFQISRYLSGILIHTTDAYELQDMTASIQLPSSIVFSVVLEGELKFSIGGYPQLISASPGSSANCFAMNLLHPTLLLRNVCKGMKLRKVNISIQHHWLESHMEQNRANDRQIMNFIERHLEIPKWLASESLLALSEQILNPPVYEGVLQTIYTESKALELVANSLQTIGRLYAGKKYQVPSGSLKRAALIKAGKIRKYIENNLLMSENSEIPQSLGQISNDIGMSISNMQRLFKQAHGQTVFEYIRQRRLEIARDAIEKKRVSISEAAYIAGYKHPSNFTTAFKKSFGISPGSL